MSATAVAVATVEPLVVFAPAVASVFAVETAAVVEFGRVVKLVVAAKTDSVDSLTHLRDVQTGPMMYCFLLVSVEFP